MCFEESAHRYAPIFACSAVWDVESKSPVLEFRDVAQLVARLVWDQDVAGSNPVIPTKIAVLIAIEAAGETLRLP